MKRSRRELSFDMVIDNDVYKINNHASFVLTTRMGLSKTKV